MSHVLSSSSASDFQRLENYQPPGNAGKPQITRTEGGIEADQKRFGLFDGQMVNRFNRFMRVAVCSLNQWSMDWDGNLKRIITAIKKSADEGAGIHVGLELEICGYSCLDHFYEKDTEVHCFESLKKILEVSKTMNMIIVTGMPIRYRATLYNCMVILSKGQIHLIHPKSALCDDDVYRESRYFKSWKFGTNLEKIDLRQFGIDQENVFFGHGIVKTKDNVKIAIEICEELWAAKSPSVLWALQGVDIICNGSGSHHVLGKSAKRISQLVQDLSSKLGGIYLYSNLRGFDGDRVYFDGMSSILQNGQIYKQVKQFELEDVAVETALLNLNATEAYRGKIASLAELSSRSEPVPVISIDLEVVSKQIGKLDMPIKPEFMTERQELFHAPPAYLWHYLRRSGASGYFLPLSGGADSGAVAAMIYLMCEKVCQTIEKYNRENKEPDDCVTFLGEKLTETDPKKLVSKLFFVSYMKSSNSSMETEERARNAAESIGANFSVQNIDSIVESYKGTFADSHGIELSHDHPDRRVQLALENIQARSRMVLAYLNAQVIPVTAGIGGFLLVLGSSNVDESLVGYLTKYDCSSADINPIGSINKLDLKVFLKDFSAKGFKPFAEIVDANPSAELRPATEGKAQSDEEEIGITYAQMYEIGLLRKPGYNGLFSTFFQLVSKWNHMLPTEIAEIVIKFYTRYTRNRHKATVSTPALVSNNYCVDDQRTDHRPFVYPDFTPQFQRLREIAKNMLTDGEKSGSN
uniref:Glutamine-dependent NAD(+) synthetase n=1 Tax=Panagrolaimus sp. JU765 TaxID=591449 RepID=A0AC34R402_9BILA